jgi:hypothetical protein
MSSDFQHLLERSGAQPPQYPRGRWRCPQCEHDKSPALSVDADKEVFYCHRCQWSGGRRVLERELGITAPIPTSAERQRRQAVRDVARRFQAWWRFRLDFYREVLHVLNDLERDYSGLGSACIQANEVTPEWVFNGLHWVIQERERFEARYALYSDPDRNGELLWTEYQDGIRQAVRA